LERCGVVSVDESPEAYGFLWSFVALEYYAAILNRVYLVLVADRMICGAYMGGPVAALPLPPAAQYPGYWVSDRRWRRYAGLDVRDPTFLRRHWMNFQHDRADLREVTFDTRPKWGMGSVPYSGRIHAHWASGHRHEFILLGQQDGPAIRDRLLPHQALYSPGTVDAVPRPVVVPEGLRPLPGLS